MIKKVVQVFKRLKIYLSEQERDGSWFGRWGTNYIYGTWSTLSALNLLDFPDKETIFAKAVDYLKSMQRSDEVGVRTESLILRGLKNFSKKAHPPKLHGQLWVL